MAHEDEDSPKPGEKQPNPFADHLPDTPYSSDPLASPQVELREDYDPNVEGHYDSMAPHRGGALMGMAVGGLLIAILGMIPFFFCFPVNLLGLALSLPAWLLAKSDLRGMDIGAIDRSSRGQTRTAYLMGLAGVLLVLLPLFVVVGMMIIGIGSSSMNEFRESLGF